MVDGATLPQDNEDLFWGRRISGQWAVGGGRWAPGSLTVAISMNKIIFVSQIPASLPLADRA